MTQDLTDRCCDPVKYASIAVCLVFSVLFARRGGSRLMAAAMALTLGADTFLLLLNDWYGAGVALFCGVTNCPLSALVLAFEVFSFCNPGGFLMAVAASFLVSGYGGLYEKQKFAFSKQAEPAGLGREDRQEGEGSF